MMRYLGIGGGVDGGGGGGWDSGGGGVGGNMEGLFRIVVVGVRRLVSRDPSAGTSDRR